MNVFPISGFLVKGFLSFWHKFMGDLDIVIVKLQNLHFVCIFLTFYLTVENSVTRVTLV